MLFNQIIGAQDLKNALVSSVSNNHVSHSQLFYGQEGCAQLAMAWAYATYLNCEQRQPTDSCGNCASCHKMKKLIHPDVHWIFPAIKPKKGEEEKKVANYMQLWRDTLIKNPYFSNYFWQNSLGGTKMQQGIIPVDEARKILEKISLKPYEGEFKIVIIWLPETMNNEAANAILKVLEEPPAKTVFLMVSNQPNSLLPTILSRAVHVYVPLATDSEMMQVLQQKMGLNHTQAHVRTILSSGSIGKATEIDTQENNITFENATHFLRSSYGFIVNDLVNFSDEFDKQGKQEQVNFLHYILSIFRDLILWQNNGKVLIKRPSPELVFIEKFSAAVNESNLETVIENTEKAIYHIERNGKPKMIIMDLAIDYRKLLKK